VSLLPDSALISQVLIFGNRRAFDSLVQKYQASVRRILLNLTAGDETLSDDLAQETFIKAYTALATYKTERTSELGSTKLHIMFFMTIFAVGKRLARWMR
jgi:hypothetical protein